ncbi:hypothetical protein VTI28DRAFT_3976 [Corynascus sepedonium]
MLGGRRGDGGRAKIWAEILDIWAPIITIYDSGTRFFTKAAIRNVLRQVDELGVRRIQTEPLSLEFPIVGIIGRTLKTDRGREVRICGGLGTGESQRWTSRRPPPQGETIVGLVAGFTGKTNRPGYGGLSSLHVLTRRLYQPQGFAVPITTHD